MFGIAGVTVCCVLISALWYSAYVKKIAFENGYSEQVVPATWGQSASTIWVKSTNESSFIKKNND